MHWRIIAEIVGFILMVIGVSMFLPLFFSIYYREDVVIDIGISSLICLIIGLILVLWLKGRKKEKEVEISHKEGMAIVTLSWLCASGFGALPFFISGHIPNYIDAFFETTSGFTTTGASILTNIEAMPKGLLMWRSLTHWLGGMGIILLSLAILPFLGVAGMQLFKAEVPGPIPDKLHPRIKDTAIILWKVYVFLSTVETALLMFGGMNLFEALCHTFGTMATGGYSTKNLSIGYYNPFIQVVIIVFMYLAGLNFSHHYKFLNRDFKTYFKDPEFFFYNGVLIVMIIITTLLTWKNNYQDLSVALRHGAFQSISILTTTGYTTANYEKWPYLAQILLFLAMFIGGCAGSTGGGIKCIRIFLLLKLASRELKKLIHPRAIIMVKTKSKTISEEVLHAITGFFFLYFLILTISALFLTYLGTDLMTAISATVACISNIGPGLGTVGPAENYNHIPLLGKVMLSFCMIAGRLEIYPVLIFFYPEFWKK